MFGFDFGGDGDSKGLMDRFRSILAVFLRILRTRLELVVTEIHVEYERLWEMLATAVVACIFLSLGLIFLSLFLIALFWDTPNRLLVIGVIAAFYLISGGLVAILARNRWNQHEKLLSTSIRELEKDIDSLKS